MSKTAKVLYAVCFACLILLIASIAAWRVYLDYSLRILHQPGVFVVKAERAPRPYWLRLVAGSENPNDVLTLSLTEVHLAAIDLRALTKFTNLSKISIENSGNVDDVLAALKELPHLERVSITAEEGSIDLNHLRELDQLTSIRIQATPDVNLSLDALAYLPKLCDVMLEGEQFTDQEVSKLSRCKRLQEITIRNARVTDECLPYFEDLKGLIALEVSNSHIEGWTLPHLARLKLLRHVDLSGNPLTDGSAHALQRFEGLTTLTLDSTMISEAGISQLIRALPHCKILPEISPVPQS